MHSSTPGHYSVQLLSSDSKPQVFCPFHFSVRIIQSVLSLPYNFSMFPSVDYYSIRKFLQKYYFIQLTQSMYQPDAPIPLLCI
jgi:hypothetical protein